MANITLKDITPKHFFEVVKLLKTTEHRIYIGVDNIEVRFQYPWNETKEETDLRFEQLEHFRLFLEQLINSTVPIDWDNFIETYKYNPKVKFFKR
ncbi:hypothetical protein N8E87_05970 [Avibacterium paragallinarum]|uniref:hypothetical protein n=1 Tax=Avibacterium paragallinarum TaxID=728 RepID=UPI0021F6BBD1|nr:hypothetical protein [Avibacterium paragallinarum]UXN37998.1 hypothetical protein N8E87_05970 [Avibacterium paragallinarum]